VSECIYYKDNRMNELQKLCESQSDIVEYWVLSVWLWVDCSLSVYVSIACATLLVDVTPGSLATPDVGHFEALP
jgi:hypothetical protein